MRGNEESIARIKKLNEELERLHGSMKEYRAAEADIRQKKRELSETRRGLRQQKREQDGNSEAARGFDIAIEELDQELEKLEEQAEALHHDIDEVEEAVEDIKEELEELEELERENTRKDGPRAQFGLKDLNHEINKATSKLSEIDFDRIGETIGRTVDRAVSGVSRGVSDFMRNSRADRGNGDFCFAGAGTLPGGQYRWLTFSGTGRLTGDITCASLKSSGSVQGEGSIECAGEIKSSGSIRCKGDLSAAVLKTSGAVWVGGSFRGGSMNVSGAVTVGGDIHAEEIKTGGAITAGGNCEAEVLQSAGRLEIAGLLNADDIRIHLEGAESTVSSIGCGKISVIRRGIGGLFADLGIKGAGGYLVTDTIEGDEIHLENTKAKIVRGRDVYIGGGCEIERVEYTNKCEVSDNATVGETVLV